ncbi:MAG: hypothetical protein A4E57_03823 [Syntrophorhabdaceae bacterium PtaU1.Bin034]|nr:MAG: hypothetical protein A4E57_03823 [Syntrophorhabdaceae bacterium PtaU1.Bin034]
MLAAAPGTPPGLVLLFTAFSLVFFSPVTTVFSGMYSSSTFSTFLRLSSTLALTTDLLFIKNVSSIDWTDSSIFFSTFLCNSCCCPDMATFVSPSPALCSIFPEESTTTTFSAFKPSMLPATRCTIPLTWSFDKAFPGLSLRKTEAVASFSLSVKSVFSGITICIREALISGI